MFGYTLRMLTGKSALRRKLQKHFRSVPVQQITTSARTFPVASRVDIQNALNDFFAARKDITLFGIQSAIGHEAATLAQLLTPSPIPTDIRPLQHDELDIWEAQPIRCLKNA